MSATLTVNVPARFYDDHFGRDLPSGKVISRSSNGTVVLVELDRPAYDDLLSDAKHYVDMGVAEFGKELVGLISSARATVRRLEKCERPDLPETTDKYPWLIRFEGREYRYADDSEKRLRGHDRSFWIVPIWDPRPQANGRP